MFCEIAVANARLLASAISHSCLAKLHLQHCQLTPERLKTISDAIKHSNHIQLVNLSGSMASGKQLPADAVAEMIRLSSSLTSVVLSNNKFIDTDCSLILEAAGESRSMQSENPLGPHSLRTLITTLAATRTLTELNLSVCGIEDDGAICVANAISSSRTLKTITLINNAISFVGFTALASAIGNSESIKGVYLNRNSIFPRAADPDDAATLEALHTTLIRKGGAICVDIRNQKKLSRGLRGLRCHPVRLWGQGETVHGHSDH